MLRCTGPAANITSLKTVVLTELLLVCSVSELHLVLLMIQKCDQLLMLNLTCHLQCVHGVYLIIAEVQADNRGAA